MTNSKSTVLVTGNTYPVKDQIKALGGRWDAASKGWRVPADKAAAAQALVAGAPAAKPQASRTYNHARYVRAVRNGTVDCNCKYCRSGSECMCIYQ
jgi:hypothetical protein